MARTTIARSAALISALLFTSCTNEGSVKQTLDFPTNKTLLTSAEIRAVHRTGLSTGSRHGWVEPTYITCAEPSPDVAKAFSESVNTGLTAAISNPASGVDPKIAASASVAQAEALAQLGERLATMQLLRDGLFRACEAYANGAISDSTYAVLLSRTDDTMVTMLLGEIAGGAFGRSLAGLGTGAEGTSSASLDATRDESRSREAEASLDQAIARQNEAGAALAKAATADTPNPAVVEDAQDKLTQTSKEVEQASLKLSDALKAEATSKARAEFVTVAGAITPGLQNAAIAESLTMMQRKYIENIHFDSAEVACLTALDRPAAQATPFVEFCKSNLLPGIQQYKAEVLRAILARHWAEVDAVAKRNDAKEAFTYASSYLSELKKMNGDQTNLTKPTP
jgi:hypothetical protein